jgi:nitrite reductase/ring-hydroxylating ferredoxin subunit
MPRVRVGPLAELADGRPRRVVHGATAVCVAVVDGQPYAVADSCPHRATALSGGVVRDGVITCPGHLWRFDLRSGACLTGSPDALPTYRCHVVDGWVEVDVLAAGRIRSIRELLIAYARSRPGPPAPGGPADR